MRASCTISRKTIDAGIRPSLERLLTVWLAFLAGSARPVAAGDGPAPLPGVESAIPPGRPLELMVPAPPQTTLRSVLVSFTEPEKLAPGRAFIASVEPADPRGGAGWTLTKNLHIGDPDVVWTVRQPQGVALRVTVKRPPDPPVGLAPRHRSALPYAWPSLDPPPARNPAGRSTPPPAKPSHSRPSPTTRPKPPTR